LPFEPEKDIQSGQKIGRAAQHDLLVCRRQAAQQIGLAANSVD
jgi:hypothetical protein